MLATVVKESKGMSAGILNLNKMTVEILLDALTTSIRACTSWPMLVSDVSVSDGALADGSLSASLGDWVCSSSDRLLLSRGGVPVL